MNRKVVSGLAALCLLLSSLCVAGVMPATAEGVTVTGGTMTAVTKAEDLPAGTNLVSGLTPKWGSMGYDIETGTTKNTNQTGYKLLMEGSTTRLVDGKVQGLDIIATDDTRADTAAKVIATQGNWSGAPVNWKNNVYITYDMGEAKTIDTVLLSHSVVGALTEASLTAYLYRMDVYVSDTLDTCLNAENKCLSLSDATGSGLVQTAPTLLLELNERVTGQFVCINIVVDNRDDPAATEYTANVPQANGTAKNNRVFWAYLSEIGVYEAEEEKVPTVTGGTMTAVTKADDLPTGTNLVSGKTPFWGTKTTIKPSLSPDGNGLLLEGSLASLNDGKVQGLDVTATAGTRADSAARISAAQEHYSTAPYDQYKPYVYLTYDLGDTKSVESVLLSHSIVGALADGAKTEYAYKTSVFVGDSADNCATATNACLTVTDEAGTGFVKTAPTMLLKLNEAKTGRYVTVKLEIPSTADGGPALFTDTNWTSSTRNTRRWAYFSEIAVYGTAVEKPPVVTGGTMTAVTKAEDLPQQQNLIGDAAPMWGNTGNQVTTEKGFLLEGNIDTLTDGAIQGLDVIATAGTRTASAARIAAANGYWSGASIDQHKTNVYLTFDLGEAKTMDTFLLSHSIVGALADVAATEYAYKLGVYVSDVKAECANEENCRLSMADTAENYIKDGMTEGISFAGAVTTAPVLLFKLDEAATGQYVTIRLQIAGKGNGDPLLFTTPAGKKRNWVYLSELGVYDSTAVPVEETYTVTRLNSEADAALLPTEENLLKDIQVKDKNGSPLPDGNGEMSQQSDEGLATDGIINGVTCPIPDQTDVANSNKFSYRTYENAPITYDLRGQVEMTHFLVAADAWDSANYWIPKAEIYVGNRITTLFDSEPVATVNLKGKIAAVVTLKQAVTARYVAFKIPATANVVRIGELAVYGTYKSHMGEVQSLIQGKLPAEDYLCEPGQVDIFNQPEGWLNDLRWSEPSDRLTDGDTNTRCAWNIISGDRYPTVQDRWYIQAGTGWSVLVYHLGGTASVESIILTSTHEWGNYYAGGADFYVGQTLKTLFDPANRVYTSGGDKLLSETDPETGEVTYTLDPSTDITDRVIRYDLDTPVEGRYVAFVITRPHGSTKLGYSVARIDELEVLGNLAADKVEIPPKTTYTDEATGCTMTVEQLNYDDVDFYDTIGGLQVTTAPWSGDKVVCNQWLQVNSDQYTFTLVDKNGQPLTEADLDGRTLRVTVPSNVDYEQGLGEVVDGEVQRIRNSRTVGDTILGNHIATYPTKIVRLVFNEEPVNGNGYAGTDIYTGGKTAGVEDSVSYGWWALCALPVLAVLLLLYVRKVKGGAAQ